MGTSVPRSSPRHLGSDLKLLHAIRQMMFWQYAHRMSASYVKFWLVLRVDVHGNVTDMQEYQQLA